MDVIQFHDTTGQEMVARVPDHGTREYKIGSQLIVEESQNAIFFRDGKALDTFGPGRHTLTTQNLPLLTRLLSLPFGGRSPFQAAVVFVSSKTFIDLKWGTKEPVVFRDQDLAMVRLRAFGKFGCRISNPQLFVNTLVGTRGLYNTDGVETYFKDVIVSRLNDLLGENVKSVFDLPALYDELAMGLKTRVADDFGKFGIDLTDLIIGAITPPPEVQKMIDERSAMGALGNLDNYMKFKAAKAMGDAANNPSAGGAAGAGMGFGVGAGMGMMMPQMMQNAMQGGQAPAAPQPAAPQPPAPQPAAPQQAAPQQPAPQPPAAPPAVPPPAPAPSAGGGGEASATPAFCYNCGNKLPGGAKFCPGCGTKIGG